MKRERPDEAKRTSCSTISAKEAIKTPERIGAVVAVPCGATTRSGEPCRKPALANGKCRLHGGKSLAGVASPAFKTGERSRYVPARWKEAYGEALEDPDLLSLRSDLARTDAQIDELLALLPESEAEEEAFVAFLSHFDAGMNLYRFAKGEKDYVKRQAAEDDFRQAMEMAELLRREVDGYRLKAMEIEGRVALLTETRRKLADTEIKRITAATKSMPVEAVRSIVWALLDIVRREVADRKTLQRIQDRFREQFHGRSGRPL